MRPAKNLLVMSLAVLLTATLNAQAQITCALCDGIMPVSVPAGTAVICDPYAGLDTLTRASAANTSVMPLSCGVAEGDKAAKKRFEGSLIGSYDASSGRTVVTWNKLSFPNVVEASSVGQVTIQMNDREIFESREWFDGKLRVSFKRDFVFYQKH